MEYIHYELTDSCINALQPYRDKHGKYPYTIAHLHLRIGDLKLRLTLSLIHQSSITLWTLTGDVSKQYWCCYSAMFWEKLQPIIHVNPILVHTKKILADQLYHWYGNSRSLQEPLDQHWSALDPLLKVVLICGVHLGFKLHRPDGICGRQSPSRDPSHNPQHQKDPLLTSQYRTHQDTLKCSVLTLTSQSCFERTKRTCISSERVSQTAFLKGRCPACLRFPCFNTPDSRFAEVW